MANKVYAAEWLQKALHDLTGAKILYESDHYTDTTAYVLHQAIEKHLNQPMHTTTKPKEKHII